MKSQKFIEKRLLTPSTANFDALTSGTTQVNDTTFAVRSFFDSQNAYGAMLRKNYSCTITYLPSIDQVQCAKIIIE